MPRAIEIKHSHLAKWPHLKEFIDRWPGTMCFGMLDDEDICGVILADEGRIHHIHVNEESRRGGYASLLVDYVTINMATEKQKMRVVVEPDNIPAVQMLISCGYRIVGFNVTWDDNRYVMEYDFCWKYKIEDRNKEMKDDFVKMAESMYVVEAVPVRIV